MLLREDPTLLRIPGPTPIPPSVQRAMSVPMIGHRGSEANELFQDVKERIKPLFGTDQSVLILTGSGTSGLETSVVNTASAGEEVLVLVTGAFGDRLARICEEYELIVHRLEVPWGEPILPEQVKEQLQKHPNIKVVYSTHCETSTGVMNPIEEISRVVHENSEALIVADGVSATGGVRTEMDDWGVDIYITGSQKGLMLPPGLTFLAVSKRAWEVIEKNKQPRFYLDLERHRESIHGNATPFTPGLSLLLGLQKVLTLLEAEGLQAVYDRHTLMMNMTREAIKALDIPLFVADEYAASTATVIKPSFNPDKLRTILRKEFGLEFAGGQQHLKNKIIRIGHMGYSTPAHVLQNISMLEIGLHRLGEEITLGQGVAGAQAVYLKEKGDHNEI